VLPAFKVPRTVFIVPAIPTNATGKLLRRAIAASLQPTRERPPYTAPRNGLEQRLAGMWEELLRHSPVGIDDDFFDLGGDSLTAVRLFARISDEFAGEIAQTHSESGAGSPVRASVLWQASTVRKLARHITRTTGLDPLARPLIEVQRGSAGTVPLMMLTGDWGGLGFYVRHLARQLDPHRPVYAMMPHDITAEGMPRTIEEMAAAFLPTVIAAQPRGPYLIGGYSHGGLVALEIARQLQASGQDVALVFAIDTTMPDPRLRYLSWVTRLRSRVLGLTSEEQVNTFLAWRYRVMNARELWRGGMRGLITYYARRFQDPRPPDLSGELQATGEDRIAHGYLRAVRQYVPSAYSGRVTVFSSLDGVSSQTGDPTLGWSKVSKDLDVVRVPGNHATCVTDHVDHIAAQLRSSVERALQDPHTPFSHRRAGEVLLPVGLSRAR
jgi:thioesterase domain-containing protein